LFALIQVIQKFAQKNLSALQQKGSFTRNFAITLSGSALSTVLGLLLTPVVSRIYPPAAYGQFAVYSSIIGNLSLLSTMSLPGAFFLPKQRSEFIDLVKLTLLVNLVSCMLIALSLGFLGSWLMHKLQAEPLGMWFYTIPVMIFVYNVNNVLSTWYLRDKQFAKRVSIDLISNIGSRVFTISYGLLVSGSVPGLLLGEFFNRLSNSMSLLLGSIRNELTLIWHDWSWTRLRHVASKYRDFLLYNLPAGYVYVLSTQLPIFALAPLFGTAVVGAYAFSLSLLELPINLLASAIAPVFQQKATETYHETPERLPAITLSLYYKLLYVGLLPFGFVTIYGDLLFKYVFGAKWELAGLITGYLGYYYVFKLLSVGTGGIYVILNKTQNILYANLSLLLVRAVAFSIGWYYHDLDLTLLLFGLGSITATFAADLNILSLLKLPIWRIAIRTISLVGLVLIILKLSRLGLAHYWEFFR